MGRALGRGWSGRIGFNRPWHDDLTCRKSGRRLNECIRVCSGQDLSVKEASMSEARKYGRIYGKPI